MNRWLNWIQGIQQEIKAFLFFSILFTLFRIVFLIIFQSQLDTTTMDSIFNVFMAWFSVEFEDRWIHCPCKFAICYIAIYSVAEMEGPRCTQGLVRICYHLIYIALYGAYPVLYHI